MKGQQVRSSLQQIQTESEGLQERQAALMNEYNQLQAKHTRLKGQLEMFTTLIQEFYQLPDGAEVNLNDGTINYPESDSQVHQD